MNRFFWKDRCLPSLVAGVLAAALGTAEAAIVSFAELTGTVGGSPALTGVFKADLSGLGLSMIESITIEDASAGLGGAPGQFSGFDLDAFRLSYTDCATAACAAGAVSVGSFDPLTGILFAPGAQRAPADLKLFGTDASGSAVDDAVATLSLFDGNASTTSPLGFLSMGDNGKLSINLLAGIDTLGLFLYIGEVGNNGEVAASTVSVSDQRVPIPGVAALLTLGLLALGQRKRMA
jgi:hypothetical protein